MLFTDNILTQIELSTDDALKESRAILDRLRTRDLYRCVSTFIIDKCADINEEKVL